MVNIRYIRQIFELIKIESLCLGIRKHWSFSEKWFPVVEWLKNSLLIFWELKFR